jgi:hypothetical protein
MIRWWQFIKRYHCPHSHLIGVYGDAILSMPGMRRLVCEDCGKVLDGLVLLAQSRPPFDGVWRSHDRERRDS